MKMKFQVFPPHEFVMDEIEAREWSRPQFMAMTGFSFHESQMFLAGGLRVDLKVAKRLARAFGGSVELWLRLQRSHDAGVQEKRKR